VGPDRSPGRFDGFTWLRGSVDILLAVAAVAAVAVFRTSVISAAQLRVRFGLR
jgi:hypothetical protein